MPSPPRLSLLLFAITVLGTLSARYGARDGLALALDLVPFIGAVAIGAYVAASLFKARVATMRVWCISYSCAACALIGALGFAHVVSVIAEAMRTAFVYDFRFYALIQLGAMLIVPGYCGVVYASRWMDDRYSSIRPMMLVWSIVLCVNVPMIPIQGFAVLFSALACLGLFVIGYLHRENARSASAR